MNASASRRVVSILVASMLLVAGNAAAQTGPNFPAIYDGFTGDLIIAAILAACVLMAGVGFAKWAGTKLAKFFG